MFQISNCVQKEKLDKFCIKNHINKLSLFGSALRDSLTAESDIDLLVEFKEGKTPGLLTLAAMEMELTDMVGRKVDLRTAGDLSRYFRDEVVDAARVQYAAALPNAGSPVKTNVGRSGRIMCPEEHTSCL